jgi:type IV secretory pathway VirB2 component (pilin)
MHAGVMSNALPDPVSSVLLAGTAEDPNVKLVVDVVQGPLAFTIAVLIDIFAPVAPVF